MIFSSFDGWYALDDHLVEATAGQKVGTFFSVFGAILISLIVGYLSLKFMKALFGAFFGYFFMYMLYMILFGWWVDNNTWLLWVFEALGFFIGLFLFANSDKYDASEIFKVEIPLLGAYFVIRSLNMYTGGFPNEYDVKGLMNVDHHSLPGMFWLYTAIIGLQ